MEYYCSPTAMTALPTHPLLSDLPKGRFGRDKRLRVPREIVSYTNGKPTRVQLPDQPV